jgi:hypothetical protein
VSARRAARTSVLGHFHPDLFKWLFGQNRLQQPARPFGVCVITRSVEAHQGLCNIDRQIRAGG